MKTTITSLLVLMNCSVGFAATIYEGVMHSGEPAITIDFREKEAEKLMSLAGPGARTRRAEVNCYKDNMPPFIPICYINLKK